jgi:hypothetical protein
MRRRRLRTGAVVALVAAAIATAGCQGNDEPGSGTGNGNGTTGTVGTATLWAVGDGPNGKPPSLAVGRMIAKARPDHLVYLGDVYGDYAELFDETYGKRLARVTWPTPGNHDWPSHRNQYLSYWRSIRGAAQPTYYRRPVAGWDVISLNSEEAVGRQSPQYKWLEQTLTGATGTCRIAFWHAPRFSAGQHGDARDLEPLWELLQGKAVAVLSGHDHTMQRLAPVDGITQFVSGAGGRSHYPLDTSDPRLEFGDNTHDGALELQLSPGRLDYRFVDAAGDTLDSGRLSCDEP